jgi:hypothetical protein
MEAPVQQIDVSEQIGGVHPRRAHVNCQKTAHLIVVVACERLRIQPWERRLASAGNATYYRKVRTLYRDVEGEQVGRAI